MKATESSGPVSPANNGMFVGRVRRRVNGRVERRGNLRNVSVSVYLVRSISVGDRCSRLSSESRAVSGDRNSAFSASNDRTAKITPDCAAHIPPSLGGHPMTASRGEAFS